MPIAISTCHDNQQWDAFVESSPHGNVFCKTAFLDALPVEYELITLVESGVITLGAIVLRRGGVELRAPHPLTMYQGVICSGSYCALPCHKRPKWILERLNLLFDELASRCDRISFSLFHSFDDIRPFQWFNYNEPQRGTFSISPRYTGILDLSGIEDFETYLTQVRSVRRQEYRKAVKDGFTIESSDNINELHRLHQATFERQGITMKPEEEELVLNISQASLENGYGELLICRDEYGTPASATLFIYDHRYGYYHFGASDPNFRKTGAGTFLLMENIRRCIDKKLVGVDFVGINSPNRGDYKTSFNAKATVYFDVDCVIQSS